MINLKCVCLMIIISVLALSNAAWARGGHGHRHSHINLGISVGGYYPGFYGSGFYGPGSYGYRSYGYDPFFYRPYYSYPQTVVVPVTPPVYIQQEQPRPAQPQVNYWHYCQNPEGYYPYVKSCPGGWLQVAPQPPAQ
ncbi:hypothetical protein C8R34_1274 [Nitrosomonas sp. Nm84]|uniref:hypothetical protein n=1 Tax=Nitrosomonas sp. Nm84 TaxID=200124 RepID=UPI000D765896|nr:hypothetical protein [Nitrosomonas sp. Nm84]PXW83482.1 hypothetical protein C8R34_1274 [Nitrosomonas sp. Nm84]